MLRFTFFLFLVLPALFAGAQETNPELLKRSQLKVNLYAVGASFNYEHRIAKQTSINAEAEINHGFVLPQHSLDGKDWAHIIYPAISLELRQYYNLLHRKENNRSITDNTGGFFSVTSGLRLPPTVARNIVRQNYFFAIPAWGMQMSVANRTNIEGRLGYAVLYGFKTQQWHAAPNIRLSIGYVIK